MSEEVKIDCNCADADCCFENGSCELPQQVKDDPVLMEKIQACLEKMQRVCKIIKTKDMLTRVKHQDKFYKVHLCNEIH